PDLRYRGDHLLQPEVADHQAVELGRRGQEGEELLTVHEHREGLLANDVPLDLPEASRLPAVVDAHAVVSLGFAAAENQALDSSAGPETAMSVGTARQYSWRRAKTSRCGEPQSSTRAGPVSKRRRRSTSFR